jgi:hypothetical protein
MIVICSYCRKFIREKEPLANKNDSHGMCNDCYESRMKQLKGLSFDEYLEGFDVPVLIVDIEGRIVAANSNALGLIDKPWAEVKGFLGGEALECIYSRLPEGCGNTVHCPACTIRRLVEKTKETQCNYLNQETFLARDGNTLRLNVSTAYREGMVSISISEVHQLLEETASC